MIDKISQILNGEGFKKYEGSLDIERLKSGAIPIEKFGDLIFIEGDSKEKSLTYKGILKEFKQFESIKNDSKKVEQMLADIEKRYCRRVHRMMKEIMDNYLVKDEIIEGKFKKYEYYKFKNEELSTNMRKLKLKDDEFLLYNNKISGYTYWGYLEDRSKFYELCKEGGQEKLIEKIPKDNPKAVEEGRTAINFAEEQTQTLKSVLNTLSTAGFRGFDAFTNGELGVIHEKIKENGNNIEKAYSSIYGLFNTDINKLNNAFVILEGIYNIRYSLAGSVTEENVRVIRNEGGGLKFIVCPQFISSDYIKKTEYVVETLKTIKGVADGSIDKDEDEYDFYCLRAKVGQLIGEGNVTDYNKFMGESIDISSLFKKWDENIKSKLKVNERDGKMFIKRNDLAELDLSKIDEQVGCHYVSTLKNESKSDLGLIKLNGLGTQFVIYKKFKDLFKNINIDKIKKANIGKELNSIKNSIKLMTLEMKEIRSSVEDFDGKCKNVDKKKGIREVISKHKGESLGFGEFLNQKITVIDLYNEGKRVNNLSMEYRDFLDFDDKKVDEFIERFKKLLESKDKGAEKFDEFVKESEKIRSPESYSAKYFGTLLSSYSRAGGLSDLFESKGSYIITEGNVEEGLKKRFVAKYKIKEFSKECIDSQALYDGGSGQGDHRIKYENVSAAIDETVKKSTGRIKIKVYVGHGEETIGDNFGILVEERREIYVFPRNAKLDQGNQEKLRNVLDEFQDYMNDDCFKGKGDLDLETCCPNGEGDSDVFLLKESGDAVKLNIQSPYRCKDVNSSMIR